MYNEKLEKLIEMALMDGELTDKEKQILFTKAESMGVDLDEFEMVLDARLYQKQQIDSKVEKSVSSEPKSDKFGDLKKCPSCGSPVQSFSSNCSDCGHEFQNIEASKGISNLYALIQSVNIDDFERSDGMDSSDKYNRKIVSIISNFPIPNSKEEIIEFLTQAYSEANKKLNFWERFDSGNYGPAYLKNAWRSKCEQVIMKGRFALKDDKRTLDEIEAYANKLGFK